MIPAAPFQFPAPPVETDHAVALTYQSTYGGSPVSVASEPTWVYVVPGNSLYFVVLGRGAQTDNHYSIPGHLVAVP